LRDPGVVEGRRLQGDCVPVPRVSLCNLRIFCDTHPMAELDHVFCLCPADAEAGAQVLERAGLTEGSGNSHDGQGTACRRFFLENAYIELLWVSNANDARSGVTQRTRLWERWSRRMSGACPFGIVLRAGATPGTPDCPFASWAYRPTYLPPSLSIDIAEGAPLEEPEFLYLGFQRDRARQGVEPISHKIGVKKLTRVGVGLPGSGARSAAARALETRGLVNFTAADDYVLSLTFDSAVSRGIADQRPHIPIVLHW
jgi:hypothetical protein